MSVVVSFVAPVLLTTGCGQTPQPEFQKEPELSSGAIELSRDVVQRLGVRTAAAEYGALSIATSAVAVVSYHADTIKDVYAPTNGWIENISVRTAGQPLHKGDSLFELYSPSLATVDEQYLAAASSGATPPINPYSGGLRAIGLTEDMIVALRQKQRSPGRIPFRADANGVVIELDIKPGIIVAQGDRLLRSAATDPIAVTLTVPESDAGAVAVGKPISVISPTSPGKPFQGQIDLVYPDVDPTTRTARARAIVQNPDGLLKANMFVTARIESEATPAIHVPRDAVIRGQDKDRVVIALGDGRFASRAVTVGQAYGNRLTILNGLEQGERVVTSGVFLIDSETNLESALRRMAPLEHDAASSTDAAHHH